ncbi:MAG TPA: translation initiation factor IF-2 [Cytophagaceae bacterium]|nr:translation initiation factor IF-2 [Cytophagaceae bacterium]
MSEDKMKRLSQAAKTLGISVARAAEYLVAKGHEVESNPNSKITSEQYEMLMKEFESSALDKKEASEKVIGKKPENVVINAVNSKKKSEDEDEEILIKNLISEKKEREKITTPEETSIPSVQETIPEVKEDTNPSVKLQGIKVVGKIDLEDKKSKKGPAAKPVKETTPKETVKPEETEPVISNEKKEIVQEPKKEIIPQEVVPETVVKTPEVVIPTELIEAKAETLKGLTVLGKIDLPTPVDRKKKVEDDKKDKKKRKRVRITSSPVKNFTEFNKDGNKNKPFDKSKSTEKPAASDKEIQDKIKSTLAKLSGNNSSNNNRAKYRKDKRNAQAEANEERLLQEKEDAKTLRVTEFISANDLASMMEVSVTQVISACMGLGMFVSINQRLDAEAITVIADEFGYNVQFTSAEEEVDAEEEEEDLPEDLSTRAPIVTIMGHVDHGKTSLLDYIRKSKVASGEAGGITQHIGAYNVVTDSGKPITFLDTPGHEAFTAMRARGAKITDIVIIVVAADDNVMPQTKEAINHAMVAGVPIVIAINKIDKPAANPDKIKEELAKENILVEDWGGKYQCELISAKSGKGIPELLEKVLLEAELLDLKANADKNAVGAIIEASLDKGRGYLATVMVQAGTLRIGDVILAGAHFGRVKAMFDHRGQKVNEAGPSTPVQILGLNGAPQAGDRLQVMEEEREAREIATKREQLIREQSIRTKKHITLDEIGRRLAIGNFKELNIIVKGDVDGSVEALSDSLLKLSTEEIQVRIIHKGVGAISESDVHLASTSDAIIVAFQVRPSSSVRKIAEEEEIEIRIYSIIYDAINDVKAAMEGMLEPKLEEVIVGTAEVRQVFKISRLGTIAGSYVTEGNIKRNNQIRVIRDGIVMHTGRIDALKHLKEDRGEIKSGFECGISIVGFNDIQEGDIIESFEEKEVKRKL